MIVRNCISIRGVRRLGTNRWIMLCFMKYLTINHDIVDFCILSDAKVAYKYSVPSQSYMFCRSLMPCVSGTAVGHSRSGKPVAWHYATSAWEIRWICPHSHDPWSPCPHGGGRNTAHSISLPHGFSKWCCAFCAQAQVVTEWKSGRTLAPSEKYRVTYFSRPTGASHNLMPNCLRFRSRSLSKVHWANSNLYCSVLFVAIARYDQRNCFRSGRGGHPGIALANGASIPPSRYYANQP